MFLNVVQWCSVADGHDWDELLEFVRQWININIQACTEEDNNINLALKEQSRDWA